MSGSLLTISGLKVQYALPGRRPPKVALDDVNLDIAPGETLGVVGESGSGKSTLGNVVLGLVRPAAGVVSFAGEDITNASARRRRQLTKELQAVFQDPYGSLNPMRTIGQTLEEPLQAHLGLDRAQRRARVGDAVARVGLERSDAERYPASFSGGQRQRIAIARALMLSPRLVICDEAVSALDLSVQAQILNLLRSLQDEMGLAMMFITHDLAVVQYMAHRVAVLYRGRVVETGSATEVCSRPSDPYTRRLLGAAPRSMGQWQVTA